MSDIHNVRISQKPGYERELQVGLARLEGIKPPISLPHSC